MTHTLLTGPLDEAGRSRIEAGVRRRYEEAGLPWPALVTWMPSPVAGNRLVWSTIWKLEEGRAAAATEALPWYRRRFTRIEPRDGTRDLIRFRAVAPPDRGTAAVWKAIDERFDLTPQHTDEAPVCYWPHPEFVVVAEPPVEVHATPTDDGDWRPHHATGPAIRWSDDDELHFWRGQYIPRQPRGETIFDLPARYRHAAFERMGWDRFIEVRNMGVIESVADPARPSGTLSTHTRPFDNACLVTADGTGYVHVADLPLELNWDTDPVVAAAAEYGVAEEIYRRSVRGADDSLVDPVTGDTRKRRCRGEIFRFNG